MALGLNFEVVHATSASKLWSELNSASSREEPIVLFNWSPNFIEAIFDGKFVQFPKYEPACRTDPAWGINPDLTHDCGNPLDGYLKKAAWEGMEAKWPRAYITLTKINFTNAQVAQMAALVDIDSLTPEDAAKRWFDENRDVWEPWTQ